MENFRELFLVRENEELDLSRISPAYSSIYNSKKYAVKDAEKLLKELSGLQDRLFASKTHSVLIILQAMDSAGKDSLIKHIGSGMGGQAWKVQQFKKPDQSDYEHNFLRRPSKALPAKGFTTIFNRSYYEYVLVCRVHPELILKERIPGIDKLSRINQEFWKERFRQIRNFEEMLVANGTIVIKFFLNISPEKQKERLLKRMDTPEKQWKFSLQDLEEREYWDEYQEAYREALKETSVKDAPWYVIPADHKWFSKLAVTSIINETLRDYNLRYPRLSQKQKDQIEEGRELLNK